MSEVKKKRFRQKIGQVFQIPLSCGKFGYCQMVNEADYSFFDYFDDGLISDIKQILHNKIIFSIGVDYYVFKEGIWKLIGVSDVTDNFKYTEPFSYDVIAETYLIWRVVDGFLKQIPATSEEIRDLECFASSNERHVTERLEDYLAGRPNYWVEHARNQHDPNFPGIVEFYKKYGYDYKLDMN